MLKKTILILLLGMMNFSFSQTQSIRNLASIWLKNDSIASCTDFNKRCPISQFDESYKLYNNQFSFFIVYKTDNEDEKTIVSLKYGNKTIKVTNKYVLKGNDTLTVLDNTRKAKIVSYLHNDAAFQKKGKLFIDLLQNQTPQDAILEIIYIPKLVNIPTKEKIETYLSLKYGFSLMENKYYRSVTNDTLWNPVKMSAFSKDVTGLGKDQSNQFSNESSYNYVLKGFEVSTNEPLLDRNYLLWGHNGKPKTIVNHQGLSTANYKVWSIRKIINPSDNRLFSLKLKKDLITSSIDSLASNEKLYLYVSHTNTGAGINMEEGQYYEGIQDSIQDISFQNIDLQDDSRFIVLKAPDMTVFSKTLEKCGENTQLQLDFAQEHYPFTLRIKNEKFSKTYTVTTKKIIINDLPEGEYEIETTDTFQNRKTAKVVVKQPAIIPVKLKDRWSLNDNNYVIVTPEISSNDSKNALQFVWLKDNQEIGTEQTIKLVTEGDYLLKVNNGICVADFNFKVESQEKTSITLYPNPSKLNEDITIRIAPNISPISIRVTDSAGKLIKQIDRNQLKDNQAVISFSTSDIYFIDVKTNVQNKIFKVIVK